MTFAIDIEDIKAWPIGLKDLLEKNKFSLVQYFKKEQEINKLAETHIGLRVNRPHNQFKSEYEQLADSVKKLLIGERLVAYHCTRLTETEKQLILSQGVKILDDNLVRERLETAFKDKHLDETQFVALTESENIKSNLSNKWGHRTGIACFTANRSVLAEDISVYRLFRSWGGEAVYAGYEENPIMGPLLRKIGVPCIVKAAIDIDAIEPDYPLLERRLISAYVQDEVEYPEPPARFGFYCKRSIRPDEVTEIIDRFDQKFLQLTAYNTWPSHLDIG